MELCYLNGDALDTLKNSLPTTYEKYFTERDNSWVVEVCGENPFVKFRDVPDFELAPLDAGLDVGEIDFRNSKTLYKNLQFLTPRQAADERFWAGFCHGAFYDYVRRRSDYDKTDLRGIDKTEAVKRITNRFFFQRQNARRTFDQHAVKILVGGAYLHNGRFRRSGRERFLHETFFDSVALVHRQ